MATGLPVQNGELVDLTFWNGVARGYWRKTTAKVVSTTAETDLLNSEFTVPANAMGTTRVLRLTCWGDCVFNSGATQTTPRFKFKMGSGPTLILDTDTFATGMANTATRGWWRMVVEVAAQGAANVQMVTLDGWIAQPGAAGTAGVKAFLTGAGYQEVAAGGGGPTRAIYRGGAAAAIDTTAAQAVLLTVITGSNTSTDVTLKDALMEII